MLILIQAIDWLSRLLILLIVVDVVLSYFMDPYHPVRAALDRFIEPLLSPIRRVLPLLGPFDISPIVLIILVQLISAILIIILSKVR